MESPSKISAKTEPPEHQIQEESYSYSYSYNTTISILEYRQTDAIMSATRNIDSINNKQGEFTPSRPRDEPSMIHGVSPTIYHNTKGQLSEQDLTFD